MAFQIFAGIKTIDSATQLPYLFVCFGFRLDFAPFVGNYTHYLCTVCSLGRFGGHHVDAAFVPRQKHGSIFVSEPKLPVDSVTILQDMAGSTFQPIE